MAKIVTIWANILSRRYTEIKQDLPWIDSKTFLSPFPWSFADDSRQLTTPLCTPNAAEFPS